MDYELETEIDPVTGRLRTVPLHQNSFIQTGINRNILYTKAEVDAKIAANAGGTTSPLTTKGDLYGYSTTNARVPIGSDGQVLTADSTQTLGLKWASVSASVTYTVTIKSTNYTVAASDDVVKVTASSVVITLPDATTFTVKPVTIKNASNGTISFSTTASQTVDGSTTGTMVPNQALTVITDGTNWIII